MQTYKSSTTVALLLPRACRLSRQQFLASMKSLLLCIEMLGLRNSKHMQHMRNDREYCSLVTIFVGWNFGWGPSLLKSTGVSGFHCERGCEKRHDLFYGFCRVGRNFMDHHAFVRVGTQNHQDTLFKQSPLFSESATKNVKDSVSILRHQKTVEVSLLGQQADILVRMIVMMSSQYQEAGDYSMCFHVCNHHRPRIGRNLPTKRVPGNFVSESRHIQLCQNLRCFLLMKKNGWRIVVWWYWIPFCDLKNSSILIYSHLILVFWGPMRLQICRNKQQPRGRLRRSNFCCMDRVCGQSSKRPAVMKRNPSMIW